MEEEVYFILFYYIVYFIILTQYILFNLFFVRVSRHFFKAHFSCDLSNLYSLNKYMRNITPHIQLIICKLFIGKALTRFTPHIFPSIQLQIAFIIQFYSLLTTNFSFQHLLSHRMRAAHQSELRQQRMEIAKGEDLIQAPPLAQKAKEKAPATKVVQKTKEKEAVDVDME